MRSGRKSALAILSLGLLTGAAENSRAATISVDFNSPGQLTSQFNNFTQANASPASTYPFAESTTGGVSNSGSLTLQDIHGSDGTATYLGQGFDFSQIGAQVTETLIFRTVSTFNSTNTASTERMVQLGVLTTQNGGFVANTGQTGGATPFPAFASARLSTAATGNGTASQSVNFQGQQKQVGVLATDPTNLTTSSNFNIAGNEYYQFTVVETQNGGGSWTVNASLQDMGADGATLTGSPHNYTATGTGLTDISTTVYAGFRTAGPAGVIDVDNFTVTYVPEPASVGLFGLGGMMVLVRRRRGQM